jgi:isopentenyldiphosphate isomerase
VRRFKGRGEQTQLEVGGCLKKWVLNRTQRTFHFIYKAPFDNGLTEHELDHVMIGYYDESPAINPEEVEAWKWMAIDEEDYAHPEIYTVGLK